MKYMEITCTGEYVYCVYQMIVVLSTYEENWYTFYVTEIFGQKSVISDGMTDHFSLRP
jgi:hypothetical protein